MKVLDLFSGIGGFSLGLERAGMETIAFCEYDEHARAVLAKHWPDIPIHKDVRELDGKQYRGSVDVVCGGFPCQDLSLAGNGSGFDGERSSLYREMLRIISECGPQYAIFENVSGLFSRDRGRLFARFLYDLAEIGFDAEWHCIQAANLGANHERERVWVIAYPNLQRCEGGTEEQVLPEPRLQIKLVRSFERWATRQDIPSPKLVGAADGLPRRLDRITRLGNSVVPPIPEAIGRAIMEAESV